MQLNKTLPLFLFFFLLACNNKEKNKSSNTHTIKVVEAKGYVVPKDSMAEPKVVFVDESKLTKIPAGKPTVVSTNLNVHPAGTPKIVLAGTPRICTPGQDTFLLPKSVPAIDSPFVAGIPETVIAKDMVNKDQNPQNFSTYGKLQGLKHNTINCMFQDRSGNLWFGTFGGVSKYDGKSFTTFTEKEGLANNSVWSILEDKSGNLWFGTFGGVSKYDGKSFTTFTEKEGLANNTVLSLLEDQSGNLWFGTDRGVSKYDGNCVDDLINGTNLYPHTQQDLKKNKKDLVKSFTTFTEKEGLANNSVRSIIEDQSGNLWFGTHGGVSKYDGNCVDDLINGTNLYPHTQQDLKKNKKDLVKSFTTFTEKEGLANNSVRSILEDQSGNLWFGTFGGGVSKYDGNCVDDLINGTNLYPHTQQDLKKNKKDLVKSFTTFTEKEGLANNSVWSILEDQSGNLWFGTYGGGVSKYDGNCVDDLINGTNLYPHTQQDLKKNKKDLVKSFTTFSDKEGLANNRVWSILEDQSGNLWFGTDGGVSKYDGKSVTTFTEKEGLANNIVLSLLEDKSGNLWFGTYGGGVSKYDGKSFTTFTEKEGLANNRIWSILEDQSGNLWFGTDGGGVSKYDGNCVDDLINGTNLYPHTQQDLKKNKKDLIKSFTTFTEKEGLANNSVRSILEDKSGNLWFGTDGGVSKYDGKSFTTFTEKEGLANNIVRSILEDQSGNLWFGTDRGVSKYDGNCVDDIINGTNLYPHTQQDLKKNKKDLVKSFTTFTEKEGLANNRVWSILEDQSGNLWFGTDGGGVSKYDGNCVDDLINGTNLYPHTQQDLKKNKKDLIKSFTTFTEKEGLANNSVRSILEDKSGNLWFGTDGGVSKYDGKSFTTFTEKEGLANNIVRSILEDQSGNLWFGTDRGVSKYDGNCVDDIINGTNLYPHTQQDLKKNKKDLVKSFTTFTEKEGLANNRVWSILEDKSGNLWFGTYGGGVSKYDGNCVDDLINGTNLYPHTQQDLKKNKKALVKSFTTFSDKEGLANNTVLSLLEDQSGNLWFGTRFGISKLTLVKLVEINNTLTKQDIIFKNYTYADGFLGIGVNGGKTMLQTKDGTIWIAANDRLTVMHPENMPPDTIAPNIQLTSIELFNENIAWVNLEHKKDSTLTLGNGVSISDFNFDGISNWYPIPTNLSLAYNNNYLTFNFIGITMHQPKNVKYQYMLEGMDENWSGLTDKTFASYGNLPHGNYIFKVKAMNSEGIWSAPFEYKFTIRPPWWKTWWFRTFVAIFMISLIVFYIKLRERKLKQRQKELEETVEERTAEVVAEKKVVEEQKAVVEEQKHLIEEKHKEITDSINYAERIQRSFLATKELLDENLGEYFVFFKPKDVVSGDFYWAANLEAERSRSPKFILATADSTGHGVPGAIMSLLNITSLEKSIETETAPHLILNKTRTIIIDRLKKDGSEEGGKDGMDCSLLVFNKENNVLQIAAANNPVWIVRASTSLSPQKGTGTLSEAEVPQVMEIKPDKMPVGKHDKQDIPFTLHEIQLQKGDVIYTLTDGFPDQFGGEKGKKFMSKKLRELLAANAHLPMHEQKQLLETTFANWKKDVEQVDDVTVIGVRVS